MPENIELLSDGNDRFEPLFASKADQDEFDRSFLEAVRPELDRLREAHQASQEQALRSWVA